MKETWSHHSLFFIIFVISLSFFPPSSLSLAEIAFRYAHLTPQLRDASSSSVKLCKWFLCQSCKTKEATLALACPSPAGLIDHAPNPVASTPVTASHLSCVGKPLGVNTGRCVCLSASSELLGRLWNERKGNLMFFCIGFVFLPSFVYIIKGV